MARRLRPRKLLLVLLAIAVCAAAVEPGSASAFRRLHHPDPSKAFANYKTSRKAHASAVVSPLAQTWPCTETSVDRAPVRTSNAPQVKVIYAYPTGAGEGDGFSTYKDLIQADAKAIYDRLATMEPGSSRSVRFDTGASGCSTGTPSEYLDVQTIALNSDAATYNAGSTFVTLTNELKSKLPVPANGARVNYVVYADRIKAGTASGEADIPQDDSHSLLNAVNQGRNGDGRLFAVVYGKIGGGSAGDFAGNGTGPRQATFLHELSHNLGAVQNSAPHASGAGHCYDEADIMCYMDGGPFFTNGGTLLTSGQTGCSGTDFAEQYDCRRDDYYNPAPAGANYLATHWNTYDSVFLCALSDCESTLSPPPAITFGTTHVNGRLTFTAGPASASIAHYEWDIDGDRIYDADTGTTPSITPDFTFVTPRTVRVRASKADGTFAFDSAAVAPVVPSAQFTVAGKFQVGQTLQLDGSGTQDPDGLITKFLWDLNGDGAYETDTGPTPTATTVFNAPGQASVGLEVDFPLGFSQSRTSPFTIAPASTPTATPPAATPPAPPAPPKITVTTPKLAKLLKSGLPFVITCGAPCTAKLTLSVDAKTAKRLKLKGKKGKPVVIGALNRSLAKGTTTSSLKLSAAARKALKKAKSLKAKLGGSVTQAPGSPLKISKALTFKR